MQKKKIPPKGDAYRLVRFLNKPHNYFTNVRANEFLDILPEAQNARTVHLYNLRGRRKNSDRLLMFMQHLSILNQIYLAQKDEHVYVVTTSSSSSGRRENHNVLLEGMIRDEELRKKIDTTILVLFDTYVLAHVHKPHYAYMKFSIGSNVETDMYTLLEETPLPFTEQKYKAGLLTKDIRYYNPKIKKSQTIFKAVYE